MLILAMLIVPYMDGGFLCGITYYIHVLLLHGRALQTVQLSHLSASAFEGREYTISTLTL